MARAALASWTTVASGLILMQAYAPDITNAKFANPAEPNPALQPAALGPSQLSVNQAKLLGTFPGTILGRVGAARVCHADATSSTTPGSPAGLLNRYEAGHDQHAKYHEKVLSEALQPFLGRWVQVRKEAGAMDEFFNLFKVSRFIRWAGKHVNGFEVRQRGADKALFTVSSYVSWLGVTETYLMNGKESVNRRRDFRWGKQYGRMRAVEGGGVDLLLQWDAPFQGWAVDELRLVQPPAAGAASDGSAPGVLGTLAPPELHLRSSACVGGTVVSFTSVYCRRT